MKIYVGAGHSDSDPGSASGNTQEAAVVEEFRNLVVLALKERHYLTDVGSDGSGTLNRPLKDAIKIARTCTGPRVEFHLNAGPATAKGVECLSMPAQKILSQRIAKAISVRLGIPMRGDQGYKADTEGARSRLAFCREAGGVIVELFFVTNAEELKKYNEVKYQLAADVANILAKA